MTYVCKEYKNIKIQLKEQKKYRTEFDKINVEPELSVRFNAGLFTTQDKEIIRYLDKYMEKYPTMLEKYDEKKKAYVDKKMAEAKEKAMSDYESKKEKFEEEFEKKVAKKTVTKDKDSDKDVIEEK